MDTMTADDLRALSIRPKLTGPVYHPAKGRYTIRLFDGFGAANVLRVLRDWYRPGSRVQLLGASCMVASVEKGLDWRPCVVLLHSNSAGTGLAETVLGETQALALLDDLVAQDVPPL